MRSVDVELPPRLRDHAPDDAPLGQIERVVGLQARVPPVASGIIRARHGADRREAGAGAPLVGGELPVEKLDQIVLAQRLARDRGSHERPPLGCGLYSFMRAPAAAM